MAADAESLMRAIDSQLSHVWMVRTFLKHSEEAEEDDELREIHRELYDYMLALGEPLRAGDAQGYLRQAHKKFARLRAAAEQFRQAQPEISGHMNFVMAAQSLTTAVEQIASLLASGGAETG